jgi:hypothetical protein
MAEAPTGIHELSHNSYFHTQQRNYTQQHNIQQHNIQHTTTRNYTQQHNIQQHNIQHTTTHNNTQQHTTTHNSIQHTTTQLFPSGPIGARDRDLPHNSAETEWWHVNGHLYVDGSELR